MDFVVLKHGFAAAHLLQYLTRATLGKHVASVWLHSGFGMTCKLVL